MHEKSLRLLLINPFPPNKNPNPHLFNYVCAAASRALGAYNLRIARLFDCALRPPKSDAALVFGSLAYVKREVKVLSESCKRAHLPLFLWSTDDPYEIDTNLENKDSFDWIWTNDKASLPFYDSQNVEHLPLAADKSTHCLPFPSESECLYDVSFVGVQFPNREKLIEGLKPYLEALDTTIVGPNWTVEARFIRRAKIANQDAAKISNRSRVVLNLGRSFDLANTRGITPSTPGPRTFEVGGCSTVQLVTWEQPEIEEYYSSGKEFIFCDSLDEIEQQISRLSADRDRRKEIAESSFKKTLSSHLYDNRLQKIVSRMRTLEA